MKYLNELLVAAGIALLAYGFNQPWSAYDAAEVKKIEFMADTEEFSYVYSEFARRVNEQIALRRSCVEQGEDCDEQETKEKMRALDPGATEWGNRANLLKVENQKAMRLAMHYQKMKNIWLAVGVLSCLSGLVVLGVGLRGILRAQSHS
ncbi:hypothetical protein [Marinobacter gudaonensis]|uniref:hypothetical protein n=1 Tax=Marinobacter gudaonensis TaxID=375760 RepID=UPI000B822CF6|nr:hypothetical protein [Marinobacter gudaonensis]